MTELQRDIAEISQRRTLQRETRRQAQLPVVALVGYTNAGKSTLLNALTDAGVFVQNKLFATLDPTVRKVTLPDNRAALLVDTVGFLTRLPTQLIAAFRATLEEVTAADLLVHVIDGSHPAWHDQVEAVESVLDDLGAGEKPIIYAVNKSDQLTMAEGAAIVRKCGGVGVTVSALHRVGLINLLRKISQGLPEPMVRLTLQVPYNRVRALYEVFALGRVLREEYGARGVSVDAELPRLHAERLQRFLRDGFREDRSISGKPPD
jgi:GTP-binding protein HflX